MDIKDIIDLYVRIMVETRSPHIESLEDELFRQFSELIVKDSEKVIVTLEDVKSRSISFCEQNTMNNLLLLHHYIETEVGEKIRDFCALNSYELTEIRDALGRVWS